MSTAYIVVPESLEADRAGRATVRPSFVYRQVLRRVREIARPGDTVYLAPANAFGGPLTEEQAAWHFLQEAGGPAFDLRCPGMNLGEFRRGDAYIDTYGNAKELARVLPAAGRDFELVVAEPHARRAAWCFRRAGYRIARVHAVPIVYERARVVRRTFYYRHPLLHRAYEFLAHCRDRIKYL